VVGKAASGFGRTIQREPGAGSGADNAGGRATLFNSFGSAGLTLGTGTAWVVVESELDGLLIHQEGGDLAGVVALGSAQIRPDLETDRALRAAGVILVSLDSDDAGAKEAWGWWTRQYIGCSRRGVLLVIE